MHIFNLFQKECSFLKRLLMSIILSFSFLLVFPIYSKAEITPVKQNIYHKHVGDSSRLAGCYTVPNTTTFTYDEECSGKMIYFPDYDRSQCNFCGAAAYGDQSNRKCYTTTPVTIETTVYELGCGKSTKTVMGYFSVIPDTEDWTKEVVLTMDVSLPAALKKNTNPFTVNGSPVSEYTYTVTSCGSYSVALNTATSYTASAAVINITNIDTTGPTLAGYTLSTNDWTNKPVVVSLNNVSDLQPDNTPGCGLHELPFSYDNGISWTAESTHTFSSNQKLTVLIRDKLGNVSSPSIEVANIDTESPQILSIDYDKTPNLKNVTLSVNATDIMSDGRQGSGLHESAFSFDGGTTWQKDNSILIDKCCSLAVMVRDKLENTAKQTVEITNIDCFGPSISYKLSPAGKTTGPVTVTITAVDKGYKDSAGIGLPQDCYSYDEGATWTDENSFVTSYNVTRNVMVRDKNDNSSKMQIKVSNIGSAKQKDPEPTKVPEDDDDPEDPEPEVIPPKPQPDPEPAILPEDPKPKKVEKPAVPPSPSPTPVVKKKETVVKEKTKEVKEVIKEPELKADNVVTVDNLPKENTSNNFRDFIIGFVCICSAFVILALLFFLYYRTVTVYNLAPRNKYLFKGICMVRNKDTFEITISEKIFDSFLTSKVKLGFSKLFIALHEGENIVIYLPDNQSYIVQPSDCVEFTFKV